MKRSVFGTLFAVTLSTCAFSQGFPQARLDAYRKSEDSTLVKMVKGIDQLIKNRAVLSGSRRNVEMFWRSKVTVLNGDKVEAYFPIDSLQGRYHIQDLKNITITFDENRSFYGARASDGVIILHKKNDKDKEKK